MPISSLIRSASPPRGEVTDPYRSIFENAIEGIFQSTPGGQYLNVNPALARMYGYNSPKHLIRELTHIDNQLYVDPSRREAFIQIMRVSGVVRGFESAVYRKDRSVIWISENARAVFDESGNIGYYEGMVEDITDRRRLEDNMSRISKQMQTLLESAGEGIYGMDMHGRCTFINRAGAEMLGYSSNELLGKVMHDLVHHHHADGCAYPKDQCPILRTFQTNQPCRVNNEVFWRADGIPVPVQYSCHPIFENEKTNGAVITFTDVTERRHAEERIAEQAALLDEAQDAIMVCDLSGSISFWSRGAELIYGFSSIEAIGQNIGELLYRSSKRFQEINAQVLVTGKWLGEIQHLRKDRHEINIQVRCTLVHDKNGAPKSILAINTDVTEKKKIEAQFLRAQRVEGIGTLAGGIAHDLNNILTPIMMSIEMLKSTAKDPNSKNILETIEVSSRRGADIVRQVLSFARGMEGERVEVQPRHLLKDIQVLLKNTLPKNVRMQVQVPEGCWTVLGDPTQLHQVLLNLSVNARDAMPDGGVLTIKVENVVIDKQYAAMDAQSRVGRYVIINVVDSGVGIPPAILDKIFDPFYTTKEIGKGTGLGLSTVMAIVKSHEGFVNVYSEPNRGTTFKICLPAMDVSSDARKQQADKFSTSRGNGETILVVDDELSILNITSQTLEAFGYRVLTATDGADAVAVYLEHRAEIAVVLTDMSMPIMDGAGLIRALHKFNPAIPIIVTSGLDANNGGFQVTRFGIKHFLAKPYTAGVLLDTMRLVLDGVDR